MMDRRTLKKQNRKLIQATNDLIRPFGCKVTGTGPQAVAVVGDDRSYDISITISVPPTMNVIRAMEISVMITNRVRGIARVLVDIPL